MAQIKINSKTYNAALISGVYDLENNYKNPKLGRVGLSYDIGTESVEEVLFYLSDDDGERVVHRAFLYGRGFQPFPSILFSRLECNVEIDITLTGFKLKKI